MKVCSAYGAGFFFIPGTDTCLKFGGRLRADYAYVPAKNQFGSSSALGVGVVTQAKDAANTLGWEARGALNFDARTNTAWGTVQSAASLRMARVTGSLDKDYAASATGAKVTLEYAYVRFAGFTFGAARDNFAFMPSLAYAGGHWPSFANGAKQLSYTATFGGGVSATIALQDYLDTASDKSISNLPTGGYYVYNSAPQVNANIRIDQSWGALQLMGAYADVSTNTATDGYDFNKGVYAIGAGLKVNLPMLAKGDALYLTANYANGMSEYTTGWTSVKTSSYAREVGGYAFNHPSLVAETTTGLETVKSWSIAAMLEHYWAPQYRSVVWGTYGQLDAPAGAKARTWKATTGFGDTTVWNVATNFAWLPTKGMEIGVEVIYSRVNQDVRNTVGTAAGSVLSKSDSNVTGRLRVERNF